jgi:uncharacterized protein YbaR (Trm112 family)
VIDSELLAILACPVCEGRPAFRLDGEYLVCTMAGHGFKIIKGIPHLLPEEVIPPEKLKELLNDRNPT